MPLDREPDEELPSATGTIPEPEPPASDTPAPKSRRDVMFDAIGEGREREVAEEMREERPDPTKDDDEDQHKDDENKDEGDEESQKPAVAAEGELVPARLKVKVDGQELEVTEDEIRDRLGLEGRKLQPSDIRNYQKHVSADWRLAQAAENRRELEAREAALAAKEAELAKRTEPPKEQKPDPLDEEASSFYESLFSDEDQAKAAIKKLLVKHQEQAPAPAANADAIAQDVQNRIDWAAAQKEFNTDFPELAGDKLLAQIANNTLTETLKTSSTYSEAFHKAGDATRKWLGTVGGKSPPKKNGSTGTPDDPFADKRARKEATRTAVVQPAGGRARGSEQEHEPTPAEVITEMRKARGLSV